MKIQQKYQRSFGSFYVTAYLHVFIQQLDRCYRRYYTYGRLKGKTPLLLAVVLLWVLLFLPTVTLPCRGTPHVMVIAESRKNHL